MPVIHEKGPLIGWILISLLIYSRYIVSAGIIYLLFYYLLKRKTDSIKIQAKDPKTTEIFQEMRHSLYTAMIFAGMGTVLFLLKKMGYTKHYLDISTYGIGYFIGSLVALIFIHDTYFYWMHRLIHRPGFFKRIHAIHHRSKNPTPFTSLSFHPFEAILEFLFVPVLTFIVPLHPLALVFLSNWSLVFNLLGHCGYEFFPKGFTKHTIGRWVNTSTHHNMHHQKANYNFGLYFNFWDTWMGTNDPDYFDRFERITQNKHASS